MTFGEKLSFLRHLKGISTRQIAEAIGVSRNAVSNYENGLRRPRNKEAYKALARLLGCSVEELMDDSVSIMPEDPQEKNEKDAASKKDKKVETAPEIKAEAPVVEKDAPAKEKKKVVQIASHGRTMDVVPLDYVSAEKDSKADAPIEEKKSDMTFGEKLHDLRTEKGLSLTQISDAIGIKMGAYSGMEYKNSRPTDVKVYDKLAEVLGCDVDYLTDGDKRFENKAAQIKEEKPVQPVEEKTATESKSESDVYNIEETPSETPFGERLSTLRMEKGLSLRQITEATGIPMNRYRRYELKSVRPENMEEYGKLADVLGCDVSYLTDGDERFIASEKKVDAPVVEEPVQSVEEPEPAPITETAPIAEVDPIEKLEAPIAEAVPTEKPKAPIPKAAPIEKQIVSASSKSSELIKLVSRLSVLLASDEIGKDEKDAVMVALNGAYWGR